MVVPAKWIHRADRGIQQTETTSLEATVSGDAGETMAEEMKLPPQWSKQAKALMTMRNEDSRTGGFALVELIVVILTLALMVGVLLPAFATSRADIARVQCADNLKQVGVAFRTWGDAYQSRYPMMVPMFDGGTSGNIANSALTYTHFAVLSNYLSSPGL
jgi:hypothetical protein